MMRGLNYAERTYLIGAALALVSIPITLLIDGAI